jgi:hypothetical protein
VIEVKYGSEGRLVFFIGFGPLWCQCLEVYSKGVG